MKNKKLNPYGDEEFIHNKEFERIKQLELDLKEIKYKFNEAEAIAKIGFWEVDPVTLNLTWTEGLFKIVGYDHKYGQVKYFDQKKFIHPDDWEYFYEALLNVLKTGKDHTIDVRVVRPDGIIRIVHLIAKPINDKNGKVIGVRGTAQDITYLKKVENDLRQSEGFYRALFEITGTATIVVDEDNTILMANSQFEKISGYSKEELEDKTSWKEMVSKEDLEIMEEYHHLRINDLGTPPEHYEARFVDKEGNIRSILINVAVIPGTKRTIASILDLTELKLAEELIKTTLERFYTILSNMRASILLVTEDDLVEFANQAFCDYFNIREAPEDLSGQTASEMIKKIENVYQNSAEEINRIQEIVGNWQPVIGEEIDMTGGRTCIRDFIPISIYDKPYGRLWLHLDITERKKMEKELADSEGRYRYLVEKASAGMFILDKNGVITYLNDHMAHILNYTKDEMLGNHIKYFVDEKDEFIRHRKPFEVQIERYNWFKFLNKTGNVFWTNLAVSPIFNSKKEYIGLLGIVSDINVQKGLEKAFLEREEIFTEIIYDMMGMLNNITKDLNKSEFGQKDLASAKKLDNN
ncbi:PAS domain-containing protein [Methanobacterium sp. CWC-01]|uniref:PAS domain-containing protein n=1 Tax=Methanobacterium aridiramus TaxID=2584467 RepID=UPI0025780EA1|nr:PAS domain S-box protein [Methanobacterium sp. CWC-01]